MKTLLFSILAASLLLITGCTSNATQREQWSNLDAPHERIPAFNLEDWEGDIVDIEEQLFAAQVTDIMFNSTAQYLGRAIRYEGILWRVYWPPTGRYHYHVIRFTDGCCGVHYSSIGFELYLDGAMPIPDGAWVEVIGVLERTRGENSIQHVRLRVASIVALEERGVEFVSN